MITFIMRMNIDQKISTVFFFQAVGMQKSVLSISCFFVENASKKSTERLSVTKEWKRDKIGGIFDTSAECRRIRK